jgi:hypothetical protein
MMTRMRRCQRRRVRRKGEHDTSPFLLCIFTSYRRLLEPAKAYVRVIGSTSAKQGSGEGPSTHMSQSQNVQVRHMASSIWTCLSTPPMLRICPA